MPELSSRDVKPPEEIKLLNAAILKPLTPVKKTRKQRKPTKQDVIENITPSKKIGRPRIEFDSLRAKHLISLGFTMAQVSNALGISGGTLKRFCNKNDDCKLYDKMSDEEIDGLVSAIKKEHFQIGEKRLLGLLKGRGVRIQRKRLRDSIHRVDPGGAKRRCNAGIALVNARTSMPEGEAKVKIPRPKKSDAPGIQVPVNCPTPNSLWRIDTVTKLERWKIIVTFSLDMFSRLMTFVLASNESPTHSENIHASFIKSIEKYSWPNMVSTDERDEKALIWKSMIEEKGDMSVEMSSKLDRVQWITIIKNDMNSNIFNPLIETFTQLEEEQSLDVSNETDLFCLHLVYLPRINKLLHEFALGYNACPIPHGSGATPSQIFYAHNDMTLSSNKDILPNLIHSSTETAAKIDLNSVCPISSDKLAELYEHVNPLDNSVDNGQELYYRTGTFVTQYLKMIVFKDEELQESVEVSQCVDNENNMTQNSVVVGIVSKPNEMFSLHTKPSDTEKENGVVDVDSGSLIIIDRLHHGLNGIDIDADNVVTSAAEIVDEVVVDSNISIIDSSSMNHNTVNSSITEVVLAEDSSSIDNISNQTASFTAVSPDKTCELILYQTDDGNIEIRQA